MQQIWTEMEIWISYRLLMMMTLLLGMRITELQIPTWTAADIATSADGAKSVFAADMDGDGDMDIVSADLLMTTPLLGMRITELQIPLGQLLI